MPECPILVLEKESGLWHPFLQDYFSDAPVVLKAVHDPSQAARIFDQVLPRIIFAEPAFTSPTLIQKIKVRKNTSPLFRAYLLGQAAGNPVEDVCDAVFPEMPVSPDFNKSFVETLPLPSRIRLLVVDDEKEIFEAVRDFFADRMRPAFEILHAPNGREALPCLTRQGPDAILLDIKMPVMDGREFYAELRKRKYDIPVIVFFDSVSGQELAGMRKSGNPAVVEKGCQRGSLSAVMWLVKKLVYFSQN